MPRKKQTTTAVKAEETVTAAVKTETAEAVTTEKKVAKKTTRTAKKVVQTAVYVQYAGKELLVDTLVEKAKAAYVAAGNQESDITTLDVYVKPEDGAAYFAVNGIGSDDYKVEL